jgi:hypothetical protein
MSTGCSVHWRFEMNCLWKGEERHKIKGQPRKRQIENVHKEDKKTETKKRTKEWDGGGGG